jgi:hypothetical protein
MTRYCLIIDVITLLLLIILGQGEQALATQQAGQVVCGQETLFSPYSCPIAKARWLA